MPVIFVLAGVNGAGKSSIGGSLLREEGLAYFNPDEAASQIRELTGCTVEEANSLAWAEGKRLLEDAIASRSNFAFETTLGGRTIPALLARAADAGFELLVWFVGLASPELHIERVRERIARGGHAIPESKIRERWDSSRRNLIALMPLVTELRVFDNSTTGDPLRGTIPEPRLLLDLRRGKIIAPPIGELIETPEWAKPILAAALQISGG